MTEILNFVQNDPFAIIIIAAVALILAFIIIFPTFFSYLKSFRVPLSLPKIKQEEAPKADVKREKTNLALPKIDFKNFSIRSPKTVLLAGVAVVALLLVGYASYDFFFRPVRIINAWQLNLEHGSKLNALQNGEPWTAAKLYLLDLRSRDSYAQGHIVESGSLPANRAKQEFYPLEGGVTVAMYSNSVSLETVKEVADAVVKNGNSGRVKYKNKGKILVIKDGFEGLKSIGLKTEEGEWD